MAYQDLITVACANIHQRRQDKANDLSVYKNFIREAAGKGSNLIVFPEMSLTAAGAPHGGSHEQISDRSILAETIPGPSTEELIKEARDHDIYIIL